MPHDKIGIPFLYVEQFGGSLPVILSGNGNIPFVWEPKLNAHVHRFASLADFQARAKQIIADERMWKIFPGIESLDLADDDNSAIKELHASLIELRDANQKLESQLSAAHAELIELAAENQRLRDAAPSAPPISKPAKPARARKPKLPHIT